MWHSLRVSSILILILIFQNYLAQPFCGLNYAVNYLKKHNPHLIKDFNFKDNTVSPLKTSVTSCYTIPVVFHILHLNGPENISDAQILDALDILNKDFRKLNPDTLNIVTDFKNLAADACIQFSLASKDPQGKCTKGILRHYDPLTNWTVIDIANYKYAWPSDKYLNIYVVKQLPPGVGGYAFLPGTVGASMDGIVILHNMVGSIGTSNSYSSRALTHEVGHTLGLPHVWGSTNNPGVTCGDDGISDTPVTKGWTNCNPSNAYVCNPGILENVQNFMEYSFCSCMFTHGQKSRMHQIIQNNIAGRGDLTSVQNLSTTGVLSPNYNCPPRPLFISNTKETHSGGSVTLTDASDYDPANTWLWKSNKSSSSYTQPTINMVFNRPGPANVFFKCGNAFGYDSIIKTNEIAVQSTVGGIIQQIQNFDNLISLDSNWFSSVPNIGSPFKLTNKAAFSGQNSIFVDVYNDYPGSNVNFYLPMFDISNLNNPFLEFHLASAEMQSNSQTALRIWGKGLIGQTWLLLSAISGSSLHTGETVFNDFIPISSQWKKISISLNPLAHLSKILLKLEFVRDPNGMSNNLYIDDIYIGEPQGLNSNDLKNYCRVYSAPLFQQVKIQCDKPIQIREWSLCDIRGKILKMNAQSEWINELAFDLPEGMYILKIITSKNEILHHKIIN